MSKTPFKNPKPDKREALPLGVWMPIARIVRFTCCRCGLRHTHTYRVRNGKAAALEGFKFVGLDSEPSYMPIAVARISHAVNSYKLSAIQQSTPNLL